MRSLIILLGGLLLWHQAGAGDLYVVVNSRNPVQTLSRQDVIALFTGRLRSFPGDGPAQAYDQATNSKARESFYKGLTGMDLARINSYWSRLQFTGQVQSPPTLADDNAIAARLETDLRGIGYLTQRPTAAALKVVYVVRTTPQETTR